MVFPFSQKKKRLLEHGHYQYWCKHKRAVVLGPAALLSESFLTFLKYILSCLVFPAVLWHSYYPIFKNTGKKSSQLLLLHSLGIYLPISQITSYRDFWLGSLDMSLWRKTLIQTYDSTMTRSGPHSTTSYTMEVGAKDKVWLSNLHTICSFLLTTALGNSGSYKKFISLVWLSRITDLKKLMTNTWIV